MNKTVYDVVAVGLKGDGRHKVEVFNRSLDRDNAEATIKFAVMRRGVDEQFYAKTTPGKYNDGDKWTGSGLA